jgi:NAD(P)-dependent dehydrogenase (short-subunit alcohol dehydrogenase family)
MQLKGTGALVTGAASGMGRATAAALGSAGAKVALLDVNAAGLESAAREIGGRACVCDMADPRQIERAVGMAIDACGPLRILVSCAGIGRLEPFVGPTAVPFAQLADFIDPAIRCSINFDNVY